MTPRSRLPNAAVASASGLFVAGVVALSRLSLSTAAPLRSATPTDLVTGTVPVPPSALAFGGGSVVLALAAAAIGSALLVARGT